MDERLVELRAVRDELSRIADSDAPGAVRELAALVRTIAFHVGHLIDAELRSDAR